jgi:hypothetical protein
LTQENLIKLVDYIIKEPAEDNHKLGHKFPFNASEILCSENVFVVEKFFEDVKTMDEDNETLNNKDANSLEDQLEGLSINESECQIVYPVIDHLFTFLNTDESLNYVLCGYFYKFFNHLANIRNSNVMSYIILHRRNFLDILIKHLNRKSICDCLNKIIVSFSPQVHQDQEFKLEILLKIFAKFDYTDQEVIIIKNI